jgi:nitrous oxide reductase
MGTNISRRSLLRRTASLTAGVVAASGVSFASREATAEPAATHPETTVAPDHDPATGEIFDRDRHHHWDTV